jgi:hypothetical protein
MTPPRLADTAVPREGAGQPSLPARASHPAGGRRWQLWRDRRAWPALAGLGLGLLALGPGLAPGYLLTYDMVFVPGPPISGALLGLTGGPPRAVPSDAVVAFLSLAVPADLVQKIILILIFVLACSGAAALLTRGWTRARGDQPPPLAALAAGVCYAWNPFVAERLLIGQWALLLGYAGLPWVLRLLCSGQGRISLARLCGALLPAAIGGFGAMGISVLAAVPAAWFGGPAGAPATGRIRRLATALLALALLSLPWLIPALLVPVHTDPRGAQAFAARPDTPFGRVGSLLMLSGIWNAQTVPRGYGGPSAAVWLLVVLVAICGYALIARPKRICPGLGVAAAAGLVIAGIGVSAPGRTALSWLVGAWPGFAVLRDGQEYLAPLALAEAIGLGAAVAWVMRGARAARAPAVPAAPARAPAVPAVPVVPAVPAVPAPAVPATRAPARRAAVALGVMAVLAPVLLLPGLAWGSAGRLRAVHYPADWLAARQIIDGDRRGGTVLLLPWAAYRRYPWNGREAVYDPWSRFLRREVISNDELQVGRLTLAPESAASSRLNRIVRTPGALTGPLRGAGVRYVVIDAGPLLARPGPGLAARARLPGARLVLASRDLIVFRLPALTARRR